MLVMFWTSASAALPTKPCTQGRSSDSAMGGLGMVIDLFLAVRVSSREGTEEDQ
jgi:hypothetical protein